MSGAGGLVVVLPELAPDAATHYAHYPALLREVSALAPAVVVVEKGGAAPLAGVEVVAQRHTNPLARAIELARILVRLRRRGYRAAYGSYSPYFGVVGSLVGRLTGMRIAFWHCRSDFFDRTVSSDRPLRRLALDTLPFVAALHLSSVVVTGTEGLARRYAETFRLPRAKVRVVPNEIDLDSWRAPPREGRPGRRPTVLFVHRLSEHKGSRLLAPIFREVLRAQPDARLLVAGGGPDERRVEADLAPELESGRVEMLGYVPNGRIRELMSEADVLLMPSLEEGFPRVLLEAMATGLPFVAADVGGVGEVVSPEARPFLVPPGDVSGFSSAVATLLSSADLRAKLAEAGLQRVRDYDVRRVAPTFVATVRGS